jgi:putative SOS response-associated peptidase YedK
LLAEVKDWLIFEAGSSLAENGMCGRYCITSAPEAIRALFRYPDRPNFPPRYNVAPTEPVPIVRLTEGERRFGLARWGLIPSWVKDPKRFALLINARGESVNDKPAFRNAMKRRRCLFPADGFYEWKVEGGRRRAFHARRPGGGPLAFAGLWETWIGPNGEELDTAAIVTTHANKEMGRVHHRAPVIVPPEQFDLWLDDRADPRLAEQLIGPPPDGSMEVYEVSAAVNKVANDTPDLVEPYSAPPEAEASPRQASKRKRAVDSGQGSLF